jgi:ABC-type multidrug transport system permease subunit
VLKGKREGEAQTPSPLPLVVFFDPTVQGVFRTAVTSSLNQVLLGIEAEEKGRALTAARSYEQASMFGAVSVVLAAALGGVMVPVYVMPRPMQAISAFSPLAWGLDGFLEIFVRGGGVGDIVSNVLSLLAFFVFSLATAWVLFRRNPSLGN